MPKFLLAASSLERQCLSLPIDTGSSRSTPDDIPRIRALLDAYDKVVQDVIPSDPDLVAPVLTHPDLSLSNIIVQQGDGPPKVQSFIDWQGAHVAPLIMQASLPPAVIHDSDIIEQPLDGGKPNVPDNFVSLFPAKQNEVMIEHRLAMRQYKYGEQLALNDYRWRRAWTLPHCTHFDHLTMHAVRCWADGPLLLRQPLIELCSMWDEISPGTTCPITFSQRELEEHAAAYSQSQLYQKNVLALREQLKCDGDGWVPDDIFEESMRKVVKAKGLWLPQHMGGPFPFDEGGWSYFLS